LIGGGSSKISVKGTKVTPSSDVMHVASVNGAPVARCTVVTPIVSIDKYPHFELQSVTGTIVFSWGSRVWRTEKQRHA